MNQQEIQAITEIEATIRLKERQRKTQPNNIYVLAEIAGLQAQLSALKILISYEKA